MSREKSPRFQNRIDSNGNRISAAQAEAYFPEWDRVPHRMVASPADLSNNCRARVSLGQVAPTFPRNPFVFVWLRRVQIGPEFGTCWGELEADHPSARLKAGDWVGFEACNVWKTETI